LSKISQIMAEIHDGYLQLCEHDANALALTAEVSSLQSRLPTLQSELKKLQQKLGTGGSALVSATDDEIAAIRERVNQAIKDCRKAEKDQIEKCEQSKEKDLAAIQAEYNQRVAAHASATASAAYEQEALSFYKEHTAIEDRHNQPQKSAEADMARAETDFAATSAKITAERDGIMR
jgi:recombination DNA repair RAD52 pathway protein